MCVNNKTTLWLVKDYLDHATFDLRLSIKHIEQRCSFFHCQPASQLRATQLTMTSSNGVVVTSSVAVCNGRTAETDDDDELDDSSHRYVVHIYESRDQLAKTNEP